MESKLTRNQTRTYGPRTYTEPNGVQYQITAKVRYDDQCGNGHNTFSITGEIYRHERGRWVEDSFGCLHDDISRVFPELSPFIKWHLVSSNGPMHYPGNALYHAGDKDHRGLRKGERRHLRNGKSGLPVWQVVVRGEDGREIRSGSGTWTDSAEPPAELLSVSWEPVWTEGEGKARELDSARSCAVWPDATDEELTAPDLESRLMARLPALMVEFRHAVESLGFVY